MARRWRGLQHMISTEDKVLSACRPTDCTKEEYMNNCELAVNIPDLHSDEWSSIDEGLADEERNNGKRPDRLKNTNSVIKIYDKKWRSTRVCEVVKFFFKKIQHLYIIMYIFIIRLKKYWIGQMRSAQVLGQA